MNMERDSRYTASVEDSVCSNRCTAGLAEEYVLALVIDDHLESRVLMTEVLASAGIAADAVGPLEAISELERLAPPLVILDVNMPFINGYEVLHYIRNSPRLKDSFVLVVTAISGMDHLKKCIELGADDFISKPFAVDELVARVRRGLKPFNESPNTHSS